MFQDGALSRGPRFVLAIDAATGRGRSGIVNSRDEAARGGPSFEGRSDAVRSSAPSCGAGKAITIRREGSSKRDSGAQSGIKQK